MEYWKLKMNLFEIEMKMIWLALINVLVFNWFSAVRFPFELWVHKSISNVSESSEIGLWIWNNSIILLNFRFVKWIRWETGSIRSVSYKQTNKLITNKAIMNYWC